MQFGIIRFQTRFSLWKIHPWIYFSELAVRHAFYISASYLHHQQRKDFPYENNM
jgi:hypothetical protein